MEDRARYGVWKENIGEDLDRFGPVSGKCGQN